MGRLSAELALCGGRRVRLKPWPRWPRADRSTEQALSKVLHSERWTISGPCTDDLPFERRFAEAFAAFHEVPYCVPTANGSAALTIAFEALGIGPSKEVLVPGLTWVACGSSVARIGATPVLVDVDRRTLCMSISAARRAITSATAAILLVHLYCTFAEIEEFSYLSASTGIPLVEDCSHSHGAVWRGRRVGTFGSIGVFSMQQTKVLTSGEGGAAITSDPGIYDRLQQYRADGRRYTVERSPGASEIEHVGSVQGHNYCMSEFHAAVLLDRLPLLNTENEVRLDNASTLTARLQGIEGIQPIHEPRPDASPVFYRYCLRFDRDYLEGLPIETIGAALSAELGLSVHTIYDPLNANQLFDPRRSPRRPTGQSKEQLDLYNPGRFALPEAAAARQEVLAIPHQAFLGGAGEVDDLVYAIEKVWSLREKLRSRRKE